MEGSSSEQPPPKPQTIVLNVLSPSTEEVPNKLTFTDIPITTTVGALKERIQNAVPARPPPPRQRLIYHGRVLASHETTLKDVFGQEAIDKLEPLSLHLVLSPLPNPHNRSSSVPPTVNSAPQANIRQQWTPFNPQANNIPNSGPSLHPNQQGAIPNAPQSFGPGPPGFNAQTSPFAGFPINLPQGPTSIPPHVQNAINSQLAAMSQHLTAQLQAAAQGQQHTQGQPHNHFHTQQWQQPVFPQPSFQQIVAQQQQARAAAGQHGLAQSQQNNGATGEQARGGPNNSQPVEPSNSGNYNTVGRGNQGPNGESFRMVIQSTSVSRPNSRVSQRPNSQSHTPQRSSTPANAPANVSPSVATSTAPVNGIAPNNPQLPPQAANALAMFQQRLSSIENALAGGYAPPQGVFDHARTYLDNMASQQNSLPQGLEAPLRTRLNNLSTQAQRMRTDSSNRLPQAFASQQATPGTTQGIPPPTMPVFPMAGSQAGQQPMPGYTGFPPASQGTHSVATSTSIGQQSASQNSAQLSTAPDIYLLSSPAGPHSLLIPPFGWYTTTLPPIMSTIPQFQPPIFNQFALPQSFPSNQAPNNAPANPQAQQINPPNQPLAPPPPMHVAQAQAQQQQQAQNQQNQARDLARILLPLGGHLWLLIRLFGFVYFFTAGGGHRRAILLGICALIVFVANTGALRPMFRTLWEPVRRHVEGLVPLAAAAGGGGGAGREDRGRQRPRHGQQQEQQPQQGQIDNTAANPNTNNRSTQTHSASRQNQQPSPTDLADRLLRERNEQSLLRRAERAVALFVASLVPGVGERHIAARDAAEARRLEGEREREARVQREREEREERERERESAAAAAAVAAQSSGNDVAGFGSGEGLRERGEREGEGGEQQRPLVEI
ncbi:MAG: hypothetical protein LQ338_001699 [Usnochroma carphineum]|nr:MAG: hypothetical protein LQ338_001699 [Usnochroma carphineum]